MKDKGEIQGKEMYRDGFCFTAYGISHTLLWRPTRGKFRPCPSLITWDSGLITLPLMCAQIGAANGLVIEQLIARAALDDRTTLHDIPA